jgi:hypothetical protein
MAKKDNLVYTILIDFTDVNDRSKSYKIGEEHAFDAERAKVLIEKGLIAVKKNDK